MDKEFVLTGNKLIAEFMGGKYNNTLRFRIAQNDIWLPKYGICRYDTTELGKGKILEYHKSWDWLMTCVEKIEEMDVVASFQIEQPTIYIWASSESSTFKDMEVDIFTKSKIEAVYKACIKFIEWYNGSK